MCVTHMVRDLQKKLYMVRGLAVSDDLLAMQEQPRPLRRRVHNTCVTCTTCVQHATYVTTYVQHATYTTYNIQHTTCTTYTTCVQHATYVTTYVQHATYTTYNIQHATYNMHNIRATCNIRHNIRATCNIHNIQHTTYNMHNIRATCNIRHNIRVTHVLPYSQKTSLWCCICVVRDLPVIDDLLAIHEQPSTLGGRDEKFIRPRRFHGYNTRPHLK